MTARENLDPDSSLWHWIACDLRFHREKHGLSGTQLGRLIGCVRSTVSNLEAGRLKLADDQARLLDRHWDTGGHFLRLLKYARAGHDPDWFRQYAQYEARARAIKIYQGQVVPSLLQTEEYARAFLVAAGNKEIEEVVAARMTRQEVLDRPDPPLLWVLLDEAVLDRPVGGRRIMRDQLARFLELAQRPNISIRIVLRAAGAHVGLDGTFQVISLETRDVAYAGAIGGGRLIEGSDDARSLAVMYDRIGAKASSEDVSRDLIERRLEGINDQRVAQE